MTVDNNGDVSQQSAAREAGTAKTPVTEDWAVPALLGAAAFVAAILATAFGSALANENDGHLEFAWTKPRSRTSYATTTMAIDAAGILAATLIGFAIHFALHALSGHARFVAGPEPVMNTLRFLLFPLAWYALIVALSARLRGGGLVQGLIWPVTLVLAVLTFAPLGPIWHAIISAVNLINPLTYLHYQDAGVQIGLGGAWISPSVAAFGLVALIVSGWAVATAQWRKLEA